MESLILEDTLTPAEDLERYLEPVLIVLFQKAAHRPQNGKARIATKQQVE